MSTEDPPSETADTGAPANKIPSQWNIPQSALELAWRVNMEILEDPNAGARNKMAASAQIKSMVDSNIKIAELNDKIERLDSGKPTEISDPGSLGLAVGDLADRISAVIGNGAGADKRTVEVVEGSEAAVRRIEDRAEPGDADPEATERP